MSHAERTAYDDATDAVAAYLQTVADLFTGKRTSLDDLAVVAVDPELSGAQRSIAQARALGHRSEPVGATVTFVWAAPYSIDLSGQPPTVVLRACVDATDLTAVSPAGQRQTGRRELLEYRVVQEDSVPRNGWAVSEVNQLQMARDRAC